MHASNLIKYPLALLTILAAVAPIEPSAVDARDGVITGSVPETALDGCLLLATFRQLFFAQHILTVQARILNSLNLKPKSVCRSTSEDVHAFRMLFLLSYTIVSHAYLCT